MELVDLYVKEVGQHLPEKMREDIQNEIRSMIEDTLDDESQSQGKVIDEPMVIEVLKRIGSPEKMASSYLPPRYLIGPTLYPYFISTLKIVLGIVTILAVLGTGVTIGWSIGPLAVVGRAIGQAALGLFNSIFYAVGIIVLIFAIIQLATPDFKIAEKGWDPRKLKAVPDPERIKPVGQVAEIIFNIFAIVLFNLFPQWVGVSSFYNGQWFTAPILTRTFIQFIPWLSLLWALQAGFHIILLAQGRWSTITRWFLVCLNVFGITIGIRLIVGPALISLEPLTMLNLGWDISNPASVQLAGELSNTAIRLAIGVAIAVQAWEIIQILYRIILRGRVSHAVAPK